MSDIISGIESKSGGGDAYKILEVKAWLISQFDAAGKQVPRFEYTPRSIAHLHNLATVSQAKTKAAAILANDFRLKATEFRAQGDISLRETGVEEKRTKAQKESKILLDHTRKAITRLTYLKSCFGKILAQLEGKVPPCEVEMEKWKTNIAVMASKERQYQQEHSNHKDKALATLAIEDKKRQCADAEQHLLDLLRQYDQTN